MICPRCNKENRVFFQRQTKTLREVTGSQNGNLILDEKTVMEESSVIFCGGCKQPILPIEIPKAATVPLLLIENKKNPYH